LFPFHGKSDLAVDVFMTDRQVRLTIEPKDFPVFLRARMMGDTVGEFAAKLNVTRSTVYMLLSGDLQPSAKILAKVGLKVAYGDASTNAHSLTRSIVEPENFSAYLQGRKGNDTVADFALKLGVSKKLAYYLLGGTRMPSEMILRKLNLASIYVTTQQ
jgi:hypothetical protein